MIIFIKSNLKTTSLEVPSNQIKIIELKHIFEEKDGIPVNSQRLFHNGKILKNSHILEGKNSKIKKKKSKKKKKF